MVTRVLEGPTEDTISLWSDVNARIQEEVRTRTINVDLERFSGIDNFLRRIY